MLNVSGTVPFEDAGFPAGEKLAEELENTRFHELKIPYVTKRIGRRSNGYQRNSGASYDKNQFTGALDAEHGAHDRRWCGSFVEIGLGRTLEGFLRKNQ